MTDITHLKCPTCKDLRRIENFLRTDSGTIFYKSAKLTTLSVEEEVALTLAGCILEHRCSACQDLKDMHGIG